MNLVIYFDNKEQLINYAVSIQHSGAVDSHVSPTPSPMPGYDNDIIISYQSLSEVSVKKGQLIGYSGTTGNSLGPHLHVEIHEQGSRTCVTDPWAAFGMR